MDVRSDKLRNLKQPVCPPLAFRLVPLQALDVHEGERYVFSTPPDAEACQIIQSYDARRKMNNRHHDGRSRMHEPCQVSSDKKDSEQRLIGKGNFP
jgi:hypothetical protein